MHILTALVIFLHGYDKRDKGEAGWWIFFLIGVLVVLVMVFHHPAGPTLQVGGQYIPYS